MRKLTLVFLLIAMTPAVAFAQNITAVIQEEARKCAKALVSADYEGVVTYTHRRVIDGMGGKEAMIAVLKRGTEQMHSQGISFQVATIGEPEKTLKVDDWLVALIPQRILMRVPGGQLEQKSYLLGISEDDGKKWVFLDVGAITTTQFEQVFPELAGKIGIPKREQPVFRKDEKA